jgi:hypothetical protein
MPTSLGEIDGEGGCADTEQTIGTRSDRRLLDQLEPRTA